MVRLKAAITDSYESNGVMVPYTRVALICRKLTTSKSLSLDMVDAAAHELVKKAFPPTAEELKKVKEAEEKAMWEMLP